MDSDSIPCIRIPPAAEDVNRPAADNPAAAGLSGSFESVTRIGKGGMGVVFLARDRRLGRYLAVKRLDETSRNDALLRCRFLREAHAMAALNHIHIVHVYALGEDAEGPYIAMEYVAGPFAGPGQGADRPNPPFTLEDLVRRHGPFEPKEAASLALKIAGAVAYAHSTGVIHRDLKPANVLIDATGEPKLADFGLARVLDSTALALTLPGEKILSLGYSAPEQEQEPAKVDARADVYGLGGIFFFLLSGRNPRYFREFDVPAEIRDTLVSALEPDPDKRCASAKEFALALAGIAGAPEHAPEEDGDEPESRANWRCKWCDTLNPATLRFCTSCGWDGSTECPECGAQSFTGMRFCQSCGADARAYETALTALKRIKRAMDAKRWQDVPAEAMRAKGFVASGPNGRAIAREIAEAGREAAANLRECESLSELIPAEMRSGNYERARAMIERFNALSSAGEPAFAGELASIPDKIFERDCERARRAEAGRDYKTLEALCASLSKARPGAPETAGFSAALESHRRRVRAHRAGIAAAAAACFSAALFAACYFSASPSPSAAAPDAAPATPQVAVRPPPEPKNPLLEQENRLRTIEMSRELEQILQDDGRFSDPFVRSAALPAFAAARLAPPGTEGLHDVAGLRRAFIERLAKFAEARAASTITLTAEYCRDLEELERDFREAGETEIYNAAQMELSRIKASGGLYSPYIPDSQASQDAPPQILEGRRRYALRYKAKCDKEFAEFLKIVNGYLAVISECRKQATKNKDDETAAMLLAEEKAIAACESLKQAEAAAGAAETQSGEESGGGGPYEVQ